MTATVEEIKKALIENPNITDDEIMQKFGVNKMLIVAAAAFILVEDKKMSEEEWKELFPTIVPVKQKTSFKNWIVDALRSIWKLGRRGK